MNEPTEEHFLPLRMSNDEGPPDSKGCALAALAIIVSWVLVGVGVLIGWLIWGVLVR